MNSVGGYVWLGLLIPLGLWLVTKPAGFQSMSYKPARAIVVAVWLLTIALLVWVGRIVLPALLDF